MHAMDLVEGRDPCRLRDLGVRQAHLSRTTARRHLSNPGGKAGAHQGPDRVARVPLVEPRHRAQRGAKCQVGVERARNGLGHTHGWRYDQVRPPSVIGGDDERGADWKLAVVLFEDGLLCTRLHLEAELVADREVEPAVHDPEAVRRTQHRIGVLREIIAAVNTDVLEGLEDLLPCVVQRPVPRDEIDAWQLRDDRVHARRRYPSAGRLPTLELAVVPGAKGLDALVFTDLELGLRTERAEPVAGPERDFLEELA
jgi:hypothetical protein